MNKALARLRARTDRELGILAQKQLETTLQLAEMGRHDDAAIVYEQTKRMLTVTNLPLIQREKLDEQMARVETALRLEAPATACA